MGEKKTSDSSFDTCFENMPFAQMKDMMAKKGVGTLCEAFMKKAQKGEWSTLYRDVTQKCEDHQGHGTDEQDNSGIKESKEPEEN